MYCVNYDNRTLYDGNQVTIDDVKGSEAGGKYAVYVSGQPTEVYFDEKSGYKYTYKYYNHKIYTVNSTNLSNFGASQAAGKAIRLYGGVPLTKTSAIGKVEFSCTITNSAGNDTYITISDEPFDNDDRYTTKTYTAGGKTYDHILLNQKLTSGVSTALSFDVPYLTDEEKINGKILYYRLSQETSTDNAVNMIMNVNGNITLKKDTTT